MDCNWTLFKITRQPFLFRYTDWCYWFHCLLSFRWSAYFGSAVPEICCCARIVPVVKISTFPVKTDLGCHVFTGVLVLDRRNVCTYSSFRHNICFNFALILGPYGPIVWVCQLENCVYLFQPVNRVVINFSLCFTSNFDDTFGSR